jgi:hypothetical protein
VLTGADGKVFIDAGITASRPRILEAANGLSRAPVKHLINTHWHFDHTDDNQWLNAEGAAIIAHENTHKHLLVAQRVEDWDFNFPSSPLPAVPTETFSFNTERKSTASSRCPPWVRSRHPASITGCPLTPRKRTSESRTVMSASGQKRK